MIPLKSSKASAPPKIKLFPGDTTLKEHNEANKNKQTIKQTNKQTNKSKQKPTKTNDI